MRPPIRPPCQLASAASARLPVISPWRTKPSVAPNATPSGCANHEPASHPETVWRTSVQPRPPGPARRCPQARPAGACRCGQAAEHRVPRNHLGAVPRHVASHPHACRPARPAPTNSGAPNPAVAIVAPTAMIIGRAVPQLLERAQGIRVRSRRVAGGILAGLQGAGVRGIVPSPSAGAACVKPLRHSGATAP